MHDPNVRRIYLVLGAVCVFFGTALLAIAGYGLFKDGGGYQQVVYVRPAWPSPPPAAAGADQGPDTGGSLVAGEPYRMVIDKLGVDAPVAAFGLDENAVPQVPYEPELVAWYTFSSYPGAGNNAVFAGHKTWRGEAVFYELDKLSIGDDIVLQGDDGHRLVYRVSATKTVESDDPSALEWMQSTGTDSITLITCGGERFFVDSVAGADYTHRLIVRAERIADGSVSSSHGG